MSTPVQFMTKAILCLAVAGGTAACGSGMANGSFEGAGDAADSGSASELLSADIRGVETQYSSAFGVVQNLRPQWLRVRSTTTSSPRDLEPVVYVDRMRFGTLESLHRIDAEAIQNMRYLRGLDATTRYGTDHGGGVIEIVTRSGS